MTHRININELTKAEVVAAFVAYSGHVVIRPRDYAERNQALARLWLVNNLANIYTSLGPVTPTQSLTAHTGVYTSNETDDDDDEMEVDQ